MTNHYNGPQRIVCLTAETAQVAVAIQAWHGYEIVSSCIPQPWPASLTEGARQLHRILAKVVNCEPLDGLEPSESLDRDFRL